MYTGIPAAGGKKLPPLPLSVGIAQATAEQSVEEFMEVVMTALRRAKGDGEKLRLRLSSSPGKLPAVSRKKIER